MEKLLTTISIDKPSLNELSHFGIKGMHWGHRIARGHAGPARMITAKRQLDANNRDLKTLDNGGHLSKGFTKKRQEMFDRRDRNALNRSNDRINKRMNRPKLTPEQKHARTKKILIAAGAVTVTAALAYGGYKLHKVRIDKVISDVKPMKIKQVYMDMPFKDTPVGKKVVQNAAASMQRQSTQDLTKEMKNLASNQAALRDQLRNLHR